MGRLVGRAARENALIDETELMMAVIRDLEGPHFRVLAELERGDVHVAPDQRVEAALGVLGSCPPPVKAALVRHGLLDTVLAYEGHEVLAGLNEFGRKILEHLRSAQGEAEGEEGHRPPE